MSEGRYVKRYGENDEVFETPAVEADGWTTWQNPIMEGYHIKCRGCGLVHEVEFRIGKVTSYEAGYWMGDLMSNKDYRIQLRMKRGEPQGERDKESK